MIYFCPFCGEWFEDFNIDNINYRRYRPIWYLRAQAEKQTIYV